MKLNIEVDNIAESARMISNEVLEYRKKIIREDPFFYKEIYKCIENEALDGKTSLLISFKEISKFLGKTWQIEPLVEEIFLSLRGRGFSCYISTNTVNHIVIDWSGSNNNKFNVFKPSFA